MWPSGDLEMQPTDNVPLRAADLGKPSLAAELIVKRRPGDHEDRTPTHGYAATGEEAMAAFAKSWQRQ